MTPTDPSCTLAFVTAPDPDRPDRPSDADELARRALVDRAVRDRHRSAAIETRRREGADLVAVLLGALDRSVVVHVRGAGAPLQGTVVAVGEDLVELLGARGTWWLRLTEVVAVEAAELCPGDPADRSTIALADVLADLVDTGIAVTLLTSHGERLTGTVRAVGQAVWLDRHQPDRQVVLAPDHVVGIEHPGRTSTG